MEASKILADLATNSRQYYKTIKDNGGFKKFDMQSRPKFTLVDMRKVPAEAEAVKEEESKLEAPAAEVKAEKDATEGVDAAQVNEEDSLLISSSSSEDSEYDNYFDGTPDDFGFGPMMM